jgi:hypothetical protein
MTRKLLMASLSIVAASALCVSCSTTGASTSPDWYAIGANEGRLGVGPQDDYLESRFSSSADRDLYLRGWDDGFTQRPMQSW